MMDKKNDNRAKIKFCDLNRQYAECKELVDTRIKEVLAHAQFINGPEVKELEEKMRSFLKVGHAVGVSSGTDALLLSLMALDIEPGDFVIVPVFTFIASAEVISMLKAVPVFVDIEKDTFNVSSQKIRGFLEQPYHPHAKSKIPLEKVKAIIAVDLFGQCAEYEEINELAREYNLRVIEDGAQSFGAEHKGKKALSLAEINCTSFFPAKPLGCFGDGGAIFTDNEQLARKLVSMKDHGQEEKYSHGLPGLNARLDTIQAAILLGKFDLFVQKEIALRDNVAQRYMSLLGELEKKGRILMPRIKKYNHSVWAQFSILVLDDRRDSLREYLDSCKIPTAIHYPRPLHMQEVFSYLGYKRGSFPMAETVSGQILSLPMHPYLTGQEQEYICESMKTFFNEK